MLQRFTIPILILLLSLNLIIFNDDFYKHEMPNYNETEINNLQNYFAGSTLNEGYSTEEIIHLKDVRNLIWLSWIIILIIIIILFFTKAEDLFYGVKYSLILTFLLPLIFLSFENSFILFHKLLFTNNYWLLDKDNILKALNHESLREIIPVTGWRMLSKTGLSEGEISKVIEGIGFGKVLSTSIEEEVDENILSKERFSSLKVELERIKLGV